MDRVPLVRQLTVIEDPMALAELTPNPGADYGEVFTRRWVVDLILDLVGFTSDHDLGGRVLVEPSCGTGAFLVPVVERLIASSLDHDRDLRDLGPALRAFELLDANAARARKAVVELLTSQGLTHEKAEALTDEWITTGDFLLHPHGSANADYVVGNPPYIRLESISRRTMDAYRRICPTMRGRADIYVGFFERGTRSTQARRCSLLHLRRPVDAQSVRCRSSRDDHRRLRRRHRHLDAQRRGLRGRRLGLPGHSRAPQRATAQGRRR